MLSWLGLAESVDRSDLTVCIDADLQHDIDQIEVFICKYRDSFFKRLSSQFYYRMLHLFGVSVVYNHPDFRLMSNRVLKQLLKYFLGEVQC